MLDSTSKSASICCAFSYIVLEADYTASISEGTVVALSFEGDRIHKKGRTSSYGID